MKKNKILSIISIIVSIALVLTGCSLNKPVDQQVTIYSQYNNGIIYGTGMDVEREYHLDDSGDLQEYTELIYQNIIEDLGSEDVFVEDVQVAYYSDEYIQDVLYNSQESVFFGYTFSELDNQFQGTKYAFTVGEDGETIVHEFEDYDFTTETIIKNVAIGTGVILVCVVVTVATYGAASEATVPCTVVVVNQVASAMTEGAVTTALSSALISGVTSGVITGLETNDMDAAIKKAALVASNAYKWGAISGAATGAITESISLAWASGGGVSISDAAFIQSKSKLPSNFIRKLSSIDQYYELIEIEKNGGLTIAEVAALCEKTKYPVDIVKLFNKSSEGDIYYKEAGLYAKMINGKMALVRDIDLDFTTETAGKMMTNLERMMEGYAAIDPATGQAYQLHHIGQSIDSPLAILTQAEHTGGGNNAILHDLNIGDGNGVHSLLSDSEWAKQREEFWIAFARLLGGD